MSDTMHFEVHWSEAGMSLCCGERLVSRRRIGRPPRDMADRRR